MDDIEKRLSKLEELISNLIIEAKVNDRMAERAFRLAEEAIIEVKTHIRTAPEALSRPEFREVGAYGPSFSTQSEDARRWQGNMMQWQNEGTPPDPGNKPILTPEELEALDAF